MKTNTITPAKFRKEAAGTMLRYGFCDSPFGETLVAWGDGGVCYLGFVAAGRDAALADFTKRWPGTSLGEDKAEAHRLTAQIFSPAKESSAGLSLWLKGTPFQIEVWKELLNIPFGKTVSYGEIASRAGRPSAIRAAGTAIGRNDLSFIIPCHRVLRSDGSLGGYYWGTTLKEKILAWEKRGGR